MLLLGGPDLKWTPKTDDANPPRFYEPLPAGPYKGKAADESEVKKKIKDYYRAAGWDKNGVPKSTALKRLGLQDVDEVLEKARA
jgi:aldehyde:ferredoxin oxidoreductase